MKILITGGSGFVGSHLVKSLVTQNHDVTVIDNCITGRERNLTEVADKIVFIKQDLLTVDLAALPVFDVVYHLASPASPPQYWKFPVETLRINSEGTYKVLEKLRSQGKGVFVLASTSEVYGDPLEHPQTESYYGNVNSFGVRSCYDEAKRYAESISFVYGNTYNVDVRIARIFNTYGPFMEKNDGRVVSNFVVQALEKKPITIYGDGKQTRSFCYVSDLVRGLEALATTPAARMEIINLGNPNEKTVNEFAQIIKEMTDTPSEIVHEGINKDDPRRRKPDISKAARILNWKPEIELSRGLKYTIEYFQTIL